MEYDINKLTLIDLLSEQHSLLRKSVETRWNEISDIQFSHTEWYLLAKVEQNSLSISSAAKIIGISRQAMQKCVIRLEKKGFITSQFIEGNNRDKFLVLTSKGVECCLKNNKLKEQIEYEITKKIGVDSAKELKKLLKKSWL